MFLKYYGEFPNVQEAIKYYKKIFNASVTKGEGRHGNIKLFDKITLLLHQEPYHREKPGYYIIKFDGSEKALFLETVNRLQSDNSISLNFDLYDARWGTTFFEFTDKYGYTWDLEISTSDLK